MTTLEKKTYMNNSKITLVKSNNSYDGVLSALTPLKKDIAQKIRNAKRVIIKVNFVTIYNPLAATPVDSVRAVLDFLKPYYSSQILVAEGATLGGTFEGYKNYGYFDLEKQYKVKLFDLNKDATSSVTLYDRRGKPFTIPFSNTVRNSDFIISVCRPKTHDTVVATLTLKNLLVGSLLLDKRSHIHQGNMIHRNLFELAKIAKPSLSVLDGTVGMQGNGPIDGTKIAAHWASAGLDFLAVDTLALYLMGFQLEDVGYLTLCKEGRLGNAFQDGSVEVIGEDPKLLRKKFKPHATYRSQVQWRRD